ILAKAYAIVAAENPILRQSYISFPWAHLYEHAEPIAAIVVERAFRGENALFFTRLRHAHTRSLADLHAAVRHAKESPLEAVSEFRRAMRLTRFPAPLRRLFMWLGFHASGRLRERNTGTFGLSSPAAEGAGMLQLITPLTA